MVSPLSVNKDATGWLEVGLQLLGKHAYVEAEWRQVKSKRVNGTIPVRWTHFPITFEDSRNAWPKHADVKNPHRLFGGPPPTHARDLTHARYLMRRSGNFQGDESRKFPLHGGKATFLGRGILDLASWT